MITVHLSCAESNFLSLIVIVLANMQKNMPGPHCRDSVMEIFTLLYVQRSDGVFGPSQQPLNKNWQWIAPLCESADWNKEGGGWQKSKAREKGACNSVSVTVRWMDEADGWRMEKMQK